MTPAEPSPPARSFYSSIHERRPSLTPEPKPRAPSPGPTGLPQLVSLRELRRVCGLPAMHRFSGCPEVPRSSLQVLAGCVSVTWGAWATPGAWPPPAPLIKLESLGAERRPSPSPLHTWGSGLLEEDEV